MSLKPRRIDFDTLWNPLLQTVTTAISGGTVPRNVWNDRFSDVYAICVAYPESLGDRLYKETRHFLEEHVRTLHEIVSADISQLLARYYESWQLFYRGSYYLNLLYGYLNSQYIKKQRSTEADISYGNYINDKEQLLEIGELALDVWKRLMVEPLQSTLVDQILQEIQRDRLVGSVSHTSLLGVIKSFVKMERYKTKQNLKFYEETFERPFLVKTGEFYCLEAGRLLAKYNLSEYMERVLQILNNENLRSRKFLYPSSYNKVTKECQQKLVADHLIHLKGYCQNIVRNESRKDLANMYLLVHPISQGLEMLVKEFQNHVQQSGLHAISNINPEKLTTELVEVVLDVHNKFLDLIQMIFRGDQVFISALDKACSAIINHRGNPKTHCRSPELLSRYCDNLLKKSTKAESEAVVEDKLSSLITVFRYLDDKDVFNRFYAKMLAKRLIYAQSNSMYAEETMINRLKQTCGYEFTNKLHQMFTDIKISEGLNIDFAHSLKEKSVHLGVNFNILVLQAGAWPVSQSGPSSFALPPELDSSFRNFEIFYRDRFNGRKLTWMHSVCYGEVKLNYLKKSYLITMGTVLLGILLPFGNSDSLTYRELYAFTQLPDDELKRNLRQLVDALLLHTEGEIGDGSNFVLNVNYSNKRTKFKLLATQKEASQEVEQTRTAIDEDRKLFLQATIVRIMKARKSLRHNQLIQEVLSQSQSRFAPSIGLIKKCIESLIDKQYIERTNGSMDDYSYVA